MRAHKAETHGKSIKTVFPQPSAERLFDLEPIAGIGESFLPVEAELKRIDEETRLKIENGFTPKLL